METLQQDVEMEDGQTQQQSIKVVPLARPYLSFGPASSQLLRENSDAQLYVLVACPPSCVGYLGIVAALYLQSSELCTLSLLDLHCECSWSKREANSGGI